jgi:hypothetical protein
LDSVVYQGTSAAFAQPTIKVHKVFLMQHSEEPVIKWNVFADEMEVKSGEVTLQSLDRSLQYV